MFSFAAVCLFVVFFRRAFFFFQGNEMQCRELDRNLISFRLSAAITRYILLGPSLYSMNDLIIIKAAN